MKKQMQMRQVIPPNPRPLGLQPFVTTPTQQVVGGGHETGSGVGWDNLEIQIQINK